MNIARIITLVMASTLALPVAASDFSFSPPPAGQMLTGKFTQVMDTGEQTTGKFWLAGKGSARWEQDGPHEMLLVSSNGMLWQVEPDLNQAVRRELPEDDLFSALQEAELRAGKSSPHVFHGEIKGVGKVEVHMAPGMPMPSMVVQHQEGVTTRFSTVRQVPVDPALFRYSPPKGMDVVK